MESNIKIMKTLVIHPDDRSTDFLKPIYQSIPNKTVITRGSMEEVRKLIKQHGRILMMGHGSPSGLFSLGLFKSPLHVIGEREVELLRGKKCVFIWCHADQFVERFKLKGLYSGMFISEVGEASWNGIKTNQAVVTESNNTFAETLGRNIHKSFRKAYNSLMPRYQALADTNPVAFYNQKRLYCNPY